MVIGDDGSIVGGPFRGLWMDMGGDDYLFRWPEPIDQVTLSPDGRKLAGANQYGFSLTATRIGN